MKSNADIDKTISTTVKSGNLVAPMNSSRFINLDFTGILLSKELNDKDGDTVLTSNSAFFKLLTLLPFEMDEQQQNRLAQFPTTLTTYNVFKEPVDQMNLKPDQLAHRLQADAFPVGQRELSCLISEWALGHFLKEAKDENVKSSSRLVIITAYGCVNVAFFDRLPLLSVVNFRKIHVKPDPWIVNQGKWLWRLHEPWDKVCFCNEMDNRSESGEFILLVFLIKCFVNR